VKWLAPDLIWADDLDAEPGTLIRLSVAVCSDCARSSFPATETCAWCGTATFRQPLESAGRLVAATAVLHSTPGAEVDVPYLVALVRFDDARLDVLGTVAGTSDVEALRPGTAVTVVAAAPFPDDRRHYAYRVAS
jgi:uncharacterized OB-fold protein